MSASKANSSAKMRGGGTRPQTTGKTPTFSINQEDPASTGLVQVTPIQMLKIHETRITNIESATKKSVNSTTNDVVSNPLIDTLYEELAVSKTAVKDLEKAVQELKATLFTLQSSVLASSQSLSKMKDDIDIVKKDVLTMSKIAEV